MPGFVDLLSILMCMTSLIWVKLIIERNEIYKIWIKYSINIEFFPFLEKQWTSKEQNMFLCLFLLRHQNMCTQEVSKDQEGIVNNVKTPTTSIVKVRRRYL